MKINGNKRVDNLNTQVFKGSNKDTLDNNELKQVEASAADALNAYGRAMITNKAQTSKDALLKLIDETIKNYEEKLDCDKDRKEEFINELKDLQTFLKEDFAPDEVSDIKLNSYLFKGYIEDDMKLVKELLNAEDENGNFRFDGYDISNILHLVNSENINLFNTLFNAKKDKESNLRFDGGEISYILYNVKPENKDILEELLDAKDKEGNFMFDGWGISSIFENTAPENFDILSKVIAVKDKSGNCNLNSWDISKILNMATAENKDSFLNFLKLLDAKDKEGNFRFDRYNISDILEKVTAGNIDSIPLLLDAKYKDGNFRFKGYEIGSILSVVKSENKNFLKELLDAKKDKEGNFRFDKKNITTILENLKPENKDIFPILLNAKDNKDENKFRFGGSEISSILRHVKFENKDILEELLDAKDKEGNLRFDGFRIYSILEKVTAENKDSLKALLNAKDKEGNFRFDRSKFSSILRYVKFENKDSLEELLEAKDKKGNLRFNGNNITFIFMKINAENKDSLNELLNAKIDKEGNFRFIGDNIYSILRFVTAENKDILDELLDAKYKDGNFRFDGREISSILEIATEKNKEILIKILDANNNEYYDKTDNYKTALCEHPELYVSGEYDDISEMKKEITSFLKNNIIGLMLLSYSFDKETMDNLFRKRLDNVKEYVNKILTFSSEEIQLLKDLCNSLNINNKPFLPEQKIDFIDLINGYKINNLSLDKIQEMAKKGIIDTNQLNLDLYKGILRNCNLTDDEISQISPEKLSGWDIQFAPHLSKEINSSKENVFNDLLKAANFYDFKEYIQDESNIYGKTNANTKNMFNNYKMNYDAWFNPSKENYVHFKTKDKNFENLSQIVEQFTEDIETLRKTPAKGFIDKQLIKFIKEDNFIIPREYVSSKANLQEFINNITKQLEPVFKRAQSNLNNPQKAQTAQNTLTILDHLKQRIDDISKISDIKSTKTLDLTIKMWDRVPQKDIFQGNYSTCCIGMGRGNGSAMPHYLMNSAYNMIELVDNISGKTIANALCYFVIDENNKPALIIDNIEIKNSQKPSNDIGVELRNAILEYANNVAFEVTGSNDTKIYMSSHFDDVPINDLKLTEKTINFLGDMECDDIYMDLYNGWVDKTDLKENLSMLELK